MKFYDTPLGFYVQKLMQNRLTNGTEFTPNELSEIVTNKLFYEDITDGSADDPQEKWYIMKVLGRYWAINWVQGSDGEKDLYPRQPFLVIKKTDKHTNKPFYLPCLCNCVEDENNSDAI